MERNGVAWKGKKMHGMECKDKLMQGMSWHAMARKDKA
jgi:hypothetical protein